MLLNKQRQLWFCRNTEEEPPKWQLLSAGIFQRKDSENAEKLRFYSLGDEACPMEEVKDSVKEIILQLHLSEHDEAQKEILACHGKTVKLVDWISSKNAENKGKICDASVEVTSTVSGKAAEPMSAELHFHCHRLQDAEMLSSVNGISFTAKNQEVSNHE